MVRIATEGGVIRELPAWALGPDIPPEEGGWISVPCRPLPKREGMLYLYGDASIAGGEVIRGDRQRLMRLVREAYMRLGTDFTNRLLANYEVDDWCWQDEEGEWREVREEIFPWTTPEEFRQAEPVPRREPGMRYFQPVHAEWIRFDGQMWRRDIDRQAWRATLAFYARLQEAPATWALTPENLQRVFLRREHELFAGVLRLLHGGR